MIDADVERRIRRADVTPANAKPTPARWLARQDWRNRWAVGYLAPEGSACCSRDLPCRLLPTAGPMLLRGPNLSDTPVEHASRIARLACALHLDVPRQIVKPQVG